MVRKPFERLRDRDHLESAENEGLEEDVEQVEIEGVEVSIGREGTEGKEACGGSEEIDKYYMNDEGEEIREIEDPGNEKHVTFEDEVEGDEHWGCLVVVWKGEFKYEGLKEVFSDLQG